jgi:DNA polymerase-1
VKLDVAKIQQYLFEIEQDIAKLENSIQEAIKPNLGIFTTWFLNKEYPLKTATGKIPKNIQKYGSQEEAWKAENDGYMFNLESKHHLKKLFFETLNAQPINSTEKGNPQVDEEFLEHMAQKYTWAQDLIYYNKLNKVKSTYYSRLLDEVEDGIFYPSFQQHRTVSGRYASDLQQLPRPLESGHPLLIKYTNVIREFILPKQDKLISADYEQLEPTTFAHVSGDKGLQNIFNSNLDFYSEIAIRTERLKDVSSDKKAENYLGKLNKSLRQKAKAYSLGIAYGMTDYKLGLDLGIEQKEAERLINDYFRAFPDLHKWIVKSHDTAITYGAIKCQSGRIRHLEDARRIYSNYGASIKNSLTLYSLYGQNHEVYTKVKEDRKIFKNLLNNAVNFQIQGLAASIVNRAAIAIVKLFAQLGIKAHIIAQIHDELVFDVSEKDCQKACEIIKNCMQSKFNKN